MCQMAKTTSINLRVSWDFRREIETLAEFHGLSMSSYTHSLLVKSIRQAKEEHPEAFGITEQPQRHLAPVVATITPANERSDAQRMIDDVPLLRQKAK